MDKNKTQGDDPPGVDSGTRQVLEPLPEAKVNQCLQLCQQMTHSYVLSHFGDFWGAWIASVEKRELNAHSNREQVALAEMIKLLRRCASASDGQFLKHLAAGFEQFQGKTLRTPSGQERFRGARLTLVDNAELEETIAITSICHRADSEQAEALWALQQRLGLLNDGRKVDERSNPLSPIQFCEALRRQIAELAVDTRTKVMGYKHFETALIKPLGGLYDDINSALAEAGVLENLRYQLSSSKATEDEPARAAEGRAENNDAPGTTVATPPRRRATDQIVDRRSGHNTESYQQGLVSAIRLLQTHIAHAVPAAGSVPAPAGSASDTTTAPTAPAASGIMDHAQLLNVVNSVQASTFAGGRALVAEMGDQVQPVAVAQVTRELVSRLQAQTGDNVRADDMHMIELVGLLFEYILSDEQLPDSVKALLSYLHTPVLKLAFIDDDFFEKVDHPARMLLNAMAESGARWVSNDGTSQNDIYAKIKTTVFFVLENFGNDVKVFTEALMDFNAYARNVSRRQELMEKRAMEKAKGEEKLREAKLQVNTYVHSRIQGKDLPSALLLLLLLPWSDYLAFVILRYGPESETCRKAFGLVDDLLWSVEPKVLQSDKVRQVEMHERLSQLLQVGFETIGYEQAKARKLLDAIGSLQKLALQSRKAEPAPEPMRTKLETMAAEKAGKVIADDSAISSAEATLIEKLKLIEFGTWLESDGGKRMKVAWYNPKTMHYMLVDQQGRKVSVMSALQLAREMIAGKLRIIAGSAKPFFERALENIYHNLNARASDALLETE